MTKASPGQGLKQAPRPAVSPRDGDSPGAPRPRPSLASRPTWRNAGAMSPEQRLTELGKLLATGYRRLRMRQKALAESAGTERPCDPVDSQENPEIA